MSDNYRELDKDGEYTARRKTSSQNPRSGAAQGNSGGAERPRRTADSSLPKTNPPSHANRGEHRSAVGGYTGDAQPNAGRQSAANRPQNTQPRRTPSAGTSQNSSANFRVNIDESDFYDTETTEREISVAHQNSVNTVRRTSAAVSEKQAMTRRAANLEANPTQAKRVVTGRMGDKYQIQDDSVIAPRQIKSRQKSVRKKNRGCMIALVYSAVVCSISILLSYYLILGINDMFGLVKDSTEIVIDVPKDASLDDVAELLDENDVVDFPVFFKLYAKFTDKDEGFKAGTFTLDTKSDYSQILQKLRRPAGADKSTIRVTIPEGYTVEQIAELMEENSVCEAEAFLDSIKNKEFTQKFLKNADTGNKNRTYKLEGYLFPDTYEFYLSEGSVNAINRLLNTFAVKWTDAYTEQANKIGMSMDEVIILASIVEREASKDADRMGVASVFYNRLQNSKGTGGKLQSDATRWYPYATYDDLMASDKLTDAEKKDWVENHKGVCDTYSVKGLPDSPICNPGISSIEAVLYHDKTDYYYFCSGQQGEFYFAKTLKEHNANLKKAGLA